MYKKKGIQESEPEVTSFFPEPDDGKFCLSKRVDISKKLERVQGSRIQCVVNEWCVGAGIVARYFPPVSLTRLHLAFFHS